MKNLIIYFSIIFLGSYSFGQKLPFKTFTSEDGLIHNKITAITEDDKGLLWVGTPYGINWYDGNRFYEPKIKAHTGQLYITGFYKDWEGTIWVLTFYNGLYKYSEGQFYNYLPDSHVFSSNSNNVFDMVQFDNNKYIVATDQDLFWFDGTFFSLIKFQSEDIRGPFNFLRKMKDGSIILGKEKGLWFLNIENGKLQEPELLFEQHKINDILIDEDLTYVSSDNGLLVYEDSKKFPYELKEKLFVNKPIYTLTRFDDGYWILSDTIYKYYHNEEKKIYDNKQGLPKNISSIFVDSENITWFGTSNGLTRLSNENYTFFDLRETEINSMTICMVLDKEKRLWLGNYEGLSMIKDPLNNTNPDIIIKKTGYTSWILSTKDGRLLTGSQAGIMLYSANGFKIISNLITTKAFEDNKNNVWLGTQEGKIYKLVNNEIKQIELSDTIPDYIDGLIIDKKNNLWVGYRGYGIRKFELRNNKAYLFKEFSLKSGFKDIRIRSSALDNNGHLLFGTRTNGLYIFDAESNKYWHLTSEDGLTGSWIKSIDVDEDNTIYLATNRGVNVINGSNYSRPIIRPLLTSQTQGIEDSNYVLYEDNELWIGNDMGYIRYNAKEINNKKWSSSVYFTQIKINGKIDSSLVPYSNEIPALKLPYNKNVIEVEFYGINKKGTGLYYTYLLEGQDQEWSNLTKRNYLSYNLPPNRYTLKVKAIDQNGVISEKPALLELFIIAPFWETTWFRILVLILISLILYSIYLLRINQIKKTYELRKSISNDLHDDIGSTLSSINILSEMALQKSKAQDSLGMVQEIKENTVAIMDRMDDIIWSINPKNDMLQGLLIRIKRFGGLVFDAKNIDYSFEVQDEINKINLSMSYRQNLYMIFKEAIINIAKHSNCSFASIQIKYEDGYLEAIVLDNGNGFNTFEAYHGNGLHNMSDRAKCIGASLKIDSKNGQGTKIILKSKMK